ncbi:MAG: thymidine kinase [Bacteroidales bacterium]|nr:thymidine kinase [Bacteroidales bacterium]
MFLELSLHSGSIEVVTGSMFSGKTEELIRRLKRAKIAGQETCIFKPLTDSRYSVKDVVSHDKNLIESVAVGVSEDILSLCSNTTKVVGIDEAQFFDMGLVEVCKKLALRGIRVIIAGLDMDYLGRPFGPMGSLMAIADDVTKVHAICTRCGSLAQFSFRLSSDKKLVSLGEKDTYEPLCRDCYKKAVEDKILVINETTSVN